MRAKHQRSEWSRKHTPGVSDPPPERSSGDGDNGTASVPDIGRYDRNKDLVSLASDIVKGQNLDHYGIYECNDAHIRAMTYEQLLRIVDQ